MPKKVSEERLKGTHAVKEGFMRLEEYLETSEIIYVREGKERDQNIRGMSTTGGRSAC